MKGVEIFSVGGGGGGELSLFRGGGVEIFFREGLSYFGMVSDFSGRVAIFQEGLIFFERGLIFLRGG